ncbi:MAG: hypothetical protein V4506_02155 [Bacteroidota bacterium]
MNIKLPGFLLLLIIAFACKPHADLQSLKTELKSDVKSDSIRYQTGFETGDTSWYKGKTTAGAYRMENATRAISIDTIDRAIEDRSPCKSVNYPYSVFTKAKLVLQDSLAVGHIGIVFDRVDDKYYKRLCISNNGTFFLVRVYDGEEEMLIPKNASRFILKGNNVYNTIEIRHQTKNIEILFNGNIAAICKIPPAYSYGEVGIVASTSQNNVRYSPLTAVFDSFVLKKIKEK